MFPNYHLPLTVDPNYLLSSPVSITKGVIHKVRAIAFTGVFGQLPTFFIHKAKDFPDLSGNS